MNNNQILNLPAPSSLSSPVRLQDVTTGIPVTTTVTGTSGHVVPFLDGNNTWSGTANQFNTPVYFKNGPWVDVKAYGAKGDNVTDDTAAFQSAAAAIGATGGGILYVPPGLYRLSGSINLINNTTLMGSGRTSTYLISRTDVPVVTLSALSQCNMKEICIFGKGSFADTADTSTFGASSNAVEMHSSGGTLYNVTIQGGYNPLHTDCVDAVFMNVDISMGYGQSNVYIDGIGQNWYIRCKWDQNTPTGLQTSTLLPFPNWTALHAYAAGDAVVTNSYVLVCKISGTSGAVAPTLKNYGLDITDGTVTWQLLAPAAYSAAIVGGNSGENHFYQIDFSGPFSNSLIVNTNAASIGGFGNIFFTDCVISNNVIIQQAGHVSISNCELGGFTSVSSGYLGNLNFSNNMWTINPGTGVSIGANVNNFNISNNFLKGGAIGVVAGTSDHYIISNNVGTTVGDFGTGIHKTVSGNVT